MSGNPHCAQPIQLIVGLGNPGEQYAATRHNAGAWLIEKIAEHYGVTFSHSPKFHGFFAEVNIADRVCKLLFPTTYMNCSGRAVQAVVNFYKIPLENILIAHDELDFAPGIARFKFGGGHNGHNGLRDIVASLGSGNFYRLRIGIGRPLNNQNQDVVNYVTARPSKQDTQSILTACENALEVLPHCVAGDMPQAMQLLHVQTS